MLKKFFIIIALIVFSFTNLFSQVLSVENKSVERGFINSVNVILRDFENASQIGAIIKFNSYLIDIKSVQSVANGIIQDETVNYTINSEDLANSFIQINSSDISNGSAILCSIEFEALAGPDSVAFFTPIQLSIDGSNVEAEFIPGRISVGIPLFPIESNSVSNIYPNPLIYQSIIDIDLTKESPLELYLYSYHGGIAAKFPNKDDYESIYIWSKSIASKINYKEGDVLPVGSYRLYLTPNPLYISAQAYYIVIKIGSDVFRRNFVIIK